MSQENVELCRRFHRAFNKRDRDAIAEVFDPDVEWVPTFLADAQYAVGRPRR